MIMVKRCVTYILILLLATPVLAVGERDIFPEEDVKRFKNLTDYQLSAGTDDGQILYWDASNNQWIPSETPPASDEIVFWDDSTSAIMFLTPGAGVSITGTTLFFDAPELDALTWSDNLNASNIWTFDVSGTDHTMTAGDGLMTFSHDVTVGGEIIADRALFGGVIDPLNPGSTAVGRWRLEDNLATTVVIDDVGSNNGTASTNTSNLNTTGKLGDAFNLNGSSEKVSWSSITEFDFTDEMSAVLWFRTSTNQTQKRLFSVTSSGIVYKVRVELRNDSGSFRLAAINGGGSHSASSTDQGDGYWADNAWHLLVATYDKSLGSERLKLYVDNSKIASDNASNDDLATSRNNVYLGGDDAIYFTGDVDNFMLYNDALSEAEISALWNSGAGNESANFASITDATIIGSTDIFTFYHATDIGSDAGVEGDLEVHGGLYSGLIAATYFGNYVGFDAPALTTDTSWTLPADDGSANQVMKTNGSEVLGWTGHDGLADFVANEHISWVDGDGAMANFKTTGTLSAGAITCTTLQTHPHTITSGSEISYHAGTAITAVQTGILEIISDSSNLLPAGTTSGIEVEAYFDPDDATSDSFGIAGAFFNHPTGTAAQGAKINPQRALFGGLHGAVVSDSNDPTSGDIDLMGIQFVCFNAANYNGGTPKGAGFDLETRGLSVIGYFGWDGKTIKNKANVFNYGGCLEGSMEGTFDSNTAEADTGKGKNYGLYAKTTNSFEGGTGDVNSYAAFLDAAASDANIGQGGVLTSWNLYAKNDVPSFLKGDLGFGQTDMAERIASDADDTLDLYAGTSIELHDATNIGDGTNESQFEADGTLEFNGSATVFDDIRTPMTAIRITGPGGTTPPDEVLYKGSVVLAFGGAGGDDEKGFFIVQVPHWYKEGSDITPHIHWTPEDNTAGVVRWILTYSWANEEAAFPGETTEVIEVAADEVTDQHQRDDFSAISGTSKTISSMFLCSIQREDSDANDTYDNKDAYLTEIDFHAEKDTVGSRAITTK